MNLGHSRHVALSGVARNSWRTSCGNGLLGRPQGVRTIVSRAVQSNEPRTASPPPKTPPLPQSLAGLSVASQSASLSSVDNATANANAFMEASICRLYYFSKSQLHVFEELTKSMRNSKKALTALAVANILLSLAQASGMGHHHAEAVPSAIMIADSGFTVGDVAYWADSLMVAGLINYATGPFEQVMTSRSAQMAYTFQGLNRLSLIFQQLAVGSIAVSTVTGLEAAVKYPPLVVGTSAVFFTVAVVRSAAMWWTLTRHTQNNAEVSRTLLAMRDPSASNQLSFLDRWATFLAFGYLLQYEEKSAPAPAAAAGSTPAASSPASATEGDSSPCVPAAQDLQHYEFNLQEERLLRGLTEAANTAGLALGLQAFVTLMLTIADYGIGDMPEMVGNGINATNKAIMTYLLFNACSAYDRALHTAGSDDVEHLMDGLGHKGLTGLFESLAVLSYAVTIATLAGLALPYLEENMMAKLVGDGLSHRGAEYLLEALEYLTMIMRGV